MGVYAAGVEKGCYSWGYFYSRNVEDQAAKFENLDARRKSVGFERPQDLELHLEPKANRQQISIVLQAMVTIPRPVQKHQFPF